MLHYSKLYCDPLKLDDDEEEQEKLLGTEANFTVFRNVNTGVALELVDDNDEFQCLAG